MQIGTMASKVTFLFLRITFQGSRVLLSGGLAVRRHLAEGSTQLTAQLDHYQARARSARARRACALRALGLLLADGTPTVGEGKTF